MTEIIIDDNTTQSGMGVYKAYIHDGTTVSGWLITTLGTTFFSTPMLMDVNNNGILDIAGSGTANSLTNVYLWNTGITFNPARIFNPMWQYNTRHNGVYGDVLLVIEPITSEKAQVFKLYQNYPNPFNASTIFSFQLAVNSNIKLTIYDVLGRQITTLINESLKAGIYEVKRNGTNLPSGVYFYKLTADSFTDTRKMILLK